jgi:hypothetical protein
MISQPHRTDLESRFLRLEKQNRRLKQLVIAALIVPATLLVMGQSPSKKSVDANEFLLKDDSGRVRVRIGMDPKYSYPEIALLDSKGQARVEVFTSDTNGGVELLNSKGKTRANFGASEDGSTLAFYDSGFKARVDVGQTEFGGGYLTALDKDQKVIWKAP